MTEEASKSEVVEQSPAAKAMKSEEGTKSVSTSSKADAKKALKVLDGSTKVEDMIQETATSIELIDAESAMKLIPELVNNIELSFFKVGGLLCRVQEEGWWKDTGHETFKAYLDAEHGLGYRKAMYLIDIYRHLVDSGVKWEQVKNVGWTKLRLIAPLLTQENVETWATRAEGMTTIQLEEYIKAMKNTGEGSDTTSSSTTSDVSSKVFKLHTDQREVIEAALDKCKHEKSTEHDNVALQYICEEYLNAASGKKSTSKKVEPAELFKNMGVEAVLAVFGEVFPDVDLEVTM